MVLCSVQQTDANQYKNYYIQFGAQTDVQITKCTKSSSAN